MDPQLVDLRNLLASLLWEKDDQSTVIQQAGMQPQLISLGNKAINNWHNILTDAAQRSRVKNIIQAALDLRPENPGLLAALQGDYRAPVREPEVQWQGKDLLPAQLEKLTAQDSTLLPISFLQRGLDASRAVARIRFTGGSGTGFLISGDLLLTNHHVIPDAVRAREADIEFNYQQTAERLDAPVTRLKLDPGAGFATSEVDDWTAVRLPGACQAWGALKLVSADLKRDQHVNIIQHPGGGPKQIAMYHNHVAFVGDRVVQYLTDTLPGSSGSPVFNDDWEVVAIHHAGGWLFEPSGKTPFLRNEGIRAQVLLEGLRASGLA